MSDDKLFEYVNLCWCSLSEHFTHIVKETMNFGFTGQGKELAIVQT